MHRCLRYLLLFILTFLFFLPSPAFAQTTPTPTSINWGSCPPPPFGLSNNGMKCATIKVPLDYRSPNGQKIDIMISRIQSSKPELRRGVLFSNPGGPGGQGLDLPRLFVDLMPQDIVDRYDLIGFDPRGIGKSSPITCNLSADEESNSVPPYPYPLPDGFQTSANLSQTVTNKCVSANGNNLQFITTANTARDMDEIRKALGEDKISYLGYSYGTYLGAVYSSLFANHVDRMVLDSAVNPNWAWRDEFRSWGSSLEIRFPDFANFAAANNATYGLGTNSDEVRNLFLQTASQLDHTPVQDSKKNVINGNIFRETIREGLHNDTSFPDTAAFWQAIEQGQIDTATQIRQTTLAPTKVPTDNSSAGFFAIVCDDALWPHSLSQYLNDVNADNQTYPLFGAMAGNAWACAFWPYSPIEAPVKMVSKGPTNILILQNDRDPATSLASGQGLRDALGNRARLVDADGGDHGIYLLTGNQCVDDKATQFFVNGTLPATDVHCGPIGSMQTQTQSSLTDTQKTVIKQLQRRMQPF